MNRWIDADELKSKVLEWMPLDPCGIEEKEFPFQTDIVVSLLMEIEEAPTIEPKQGEWLFKEITDDYHVIGRCSICKERRRIDNFCPNCGAKMKE